MLTGELLGAALAEAMKKKGVGTNELAAAFDVRPPSVTGWKKTGRIDKRHLERLFKFFTPECGPEHWGLNAGNAFAGRQAPPNTPPDSALDGGGQSPQSETNITDAEQYQMSPQEQGILELMRMVRPEDHHKVAEAITSIINGYTAAASAKLGVAAPESNRPFLRPRSGGG